ncbi:MAG: TraB/GumN family protein [Prosthecobacter sp.]|uniref:TraB/GumN family protein n=1 Tax=Prosthecobacter sp. TaxID=1965333 RepID=UPI0025FBEEA1|nr:TraB/GumN family protein [Prosthecobacter sp.]MCF7786361.1 TraB/GumN family protein [Prosthecobacter sp.]
MLIPRFLLALALFACVVACNREAVKPGTNPDAAAFVADGDGDGSVWVVDGPNGGRLFLCGTIHILREKDYPLAPAYEAAYMYSNKLVLELPPGAATGSELTSRMRQLGMYPADTSLEANVSKDTWKEVKKWAAKHGQDSASLNRFRPWFVALMITSIEYAALGAKADQGVDSFFEERAKKDGKPAQGLETVEFQIQLFASLSEKQQRELLEQTLDEVSSVKEEFEKMIKAWKYGQLDELKEMLFREQEKYPDLMNLFLSARNLSWMDRLDQMLKNGEKVMVLVGTGHFTSDTGLIELFRKRGYRVRHYREVTDF